jgi:formylglycine-generating enzyme required for sulfatase activity
MKKWLWVVVIVAGLLLIGSVLAYRIAQSSFEEQLHYEKEETELIVSPTRKAELRLFRAGKELGDTREIPSFNHFSVWLPKGNYFLRLMQSGIVSYYPAPILGYRSGPDEEGALALTIRPYPTEFPPRLLSDSSEFVYIPSGHFVIGDRLNPKEPHYVWLPAYFIAAFEVTNAEFQAFLDTPDGYHDPSNWTADGLKWKASVSSRTTAALLPESEEWKRFGQPDQPVVEIKWYEANAYCKWLTRKIGNEKWIYALPSEAEWEKAARGPDSFDYGLGVSLSDAQVKLYNWKKNPDAPITVIGIKDSKTQYQPNRYGLYHVSGNVAEWTQTIDRPFNRKQPYLDDDDRNHDSVSGSRVVRGGSWYSASIALLYLPYRDTFQPEHSSNERGFRIVARRLPNR